jgi:very-short-patch-repair endonuclease
VGSITEIVIRHDIPVQVRISATAAEQHGLITRAQLLAMGLGRGAIEHRIETGLLHVVRRGVYAVGHEALRSQARILSAVLFVGADAVASHATAAAIHGIRPSASEYVDVTVPRRIRGTLGVRLHIAELPAEHVTVVDAIPVTTVERTLYDGSATWRLPMLRRAMEAAEAQRIVDWRVLEELAAAGDGRRGIRALRAILGERSVGTRVTRQELEARFQDLLRTAGLPLPATNVVVEGFEVDCAWPAARLVVELDSRRYHHTADAFERDRRRDRALTLAGWRVIRVTWRQLHHEREALVGDLRTLLATTG